MSLPLDDNGNHIADQWEKDKSIYDKYLPTDWDDEDTPTGWKNKGDGLSLFEEYRGFLVEPKTGSVPEEFQRLIPNRRKLFIYPVGADKPLYKAGAQLFTDNIDVDTYILHDAVRLKPFGGSVYPRWMNFNKTPYTLVGQCALWIVDSDTATGNPGFTASTDPQLDATFRCPTMISRINISRLRSEEQITDWQNALPPLSPMNKVPDYFVSAAANLGLDLLQVGNHLAQPGVKTALINHFIAFVVMHELGHAVGGRHHQLDQYIAYQPVGADEKARAKDLTRAELEFYSSGDHACIMRYWQDDDDQGDVLLLLAGKWDLTHPAAGGKWLFCESEDRPHIYIKPE